MNSWNILVNSFHQLKFYTVLKAVSLIWRWPGRKNKNTRNAITIRRLLENRPTYLEERNMCVSLESMSKRVLVFQQQRYIPSHHAPKWPLVFRQKWDVLTRELNCRPQKFISALEKFLCMTYALYSINQDKIN